MILIFAKAGEGVGKATRWATWLWKVDFVVCEADGYSQGFAVRNAYDRASQRKDNVQWKLLGYEETNEN